MKHLGVHHKAKLALARLLAKLNLIENEDLFPDLLASAQAPLAFFSGRELFLEEDAARVLSEHLKLPLIRLPRQQHEQLLKLFDRPQLNGVALSKWMETTALPYELSSDRLKLVMANPLDHESKSALEFELGLKIEVCLGYEREIKELLLQKLNSSPLFDIQNILKATTPNVSSESDAAKQETNIVEGDLEAAPVVRLVNKIFSDAVAAGASDIHISPEQNSLKVKIRVDGIMQALLEVPAPLRANVASRVKLLGGMDISEKRKPQDGRLRIKTAHGIKDLRISSAPTAFGENLVMRILSSDFSKVSFELLGMPQEIQDALSANLRGTSKVLLVTGPTGSGKTSTLYAALMRLCDGKSNIVTIEDPIEYRIAGVNQIQVNSKIGVTFAEGLRSVLRQDPDVIMVGEIRDGETASIAMQSAQTGHLVLSSLHTNSAAGAITRLHDLGLPAYLTASSIGAVLAQRLVRRLCSACKEAEVDSSKERLEQLGIESGNLYKAKGCDECRGTGYAGRIGVYSILQVDGQVSDAIRSGKGEDELERLARSRGFRSLEESALDLLSQGTTSIEEVERVLGVLERFNVSSLRATYANGVAAEKERAQRGLGKRKILLVEDDDNTRVVLSMVLETEMFEVAQASNGAEALDMVYQQVPDLILCDLMMPKMDGAQMLERLRRDARTRNIPVIMLTAADTEQNELNSLARGADDFVSKTSDSKVLLARVFRLLERSAASQS